MTPEQEAQILQAARKTPFHPLEIIPYFRRWKASQLRDLLYTFIWNTAIGLVFLGVAFVASGRVSAKALGYNLVFANCIGYTIHGLFHLGGLTIEGWVVRQSRLVMTAYYSGVATVGVVIGWFIGGWLLDLDITRITMRPGWLFVVAVNCVIISLIIMAIYVSREKQMLAEMKLERERARYAEIEHNAMVANLRMLQAQIEPHFLFNTLANVTSLIHPAPDKAKLMLESFIHYLRGSLNSSREERTTLDREFQLMKQLLAILQIRMGERLKVEVNLPDDLTTASVPPMLIQPLVENAIKHGLEPKMEGGTLTLSALREGASIRIVVADTGLGFSGATSSGVGLKNVRERLKALYGDAGKLTIEDNSPSGTRVILDIPA